VIVTEGGATVDDENILKRINELAAEEHELFQKESRGEATEADVERLRHLEVTLDQSWISLHQRRARRMRASIPMRRRCVTSEPSRAT
jgi:hypothetical protein